MEILTLTIIAILVGLALALVAYPLWQQHRPEALFKVNRTGQTLEEYQARYSAALVAIKDLMFDHEMGKITTADYDTLLAEAKLEAAQIRKNIDRLSQGDNLPQVDATLNQEIETLIAQARQQTAANHQPLPPDIDAEIKRLTTLHLGGAATDCPNCGAPIQPTDAFCTRCGQAVAHTNAVFCAKCGRQAQPGDAFCVRCGAAVGVAHAAPNSQD